MLMSGKVSFFSVQPLPCPFCHAFHCSVSYCFSPDNGHHPPGLLYRSDPEVCFPLLSLPTLNKHNTEAAVKPDILCFLCQTASKRTSPVKKEGSKTMAELQVRHATCAVII